MKQKKQATCHPLEKHQAKGLCRRCYKRQTMRTLRAKIKADPERYTKYLEQTRKTNTKRRQRFTPEQRKQAYLNTLAWNKEHPERCHQLRQDEKQRLRQQTVAAYGGQCACCGEVEPKFLAIDHIDGGGNKHRQRLGMKAGVGQFYRWLRQQGFPPGYRVLCHNCNQAIGNYGFCPHQP